MIEFDIPGDIIKLLEAYLEKFDRQPPIFAKPWPMVREELRQALREGKPVPEPELPMGAVI